MVVVLVVVGLCDEFTQIYQGYFSGTASHLNPKGYGYTDCHYIYNKTQQIMNHMYNLSMYSVCCEVMQDLDNKFERFCFLRMGDTNK